jgi:tetratricopeptide (TPR) repeat protein
VHVKLGWIKRSQVFLTCGLVMFGLAAFAIDALSPARADDRQACEKARAAVAIAACTRLIDAGGSDKDLAAYHRNRGIRHRANDDYDRAIADFDAAIKRDPTLATAYGQRGWALYLKRDYDRAIADADEAIRLGPKLDQPHVTRGNALRGKGDVERALTEYAAALDKNPGNVNAHYYRGITLRDKGEHDRALADFDAAIKLDPKYASALAHRGWTYHLKRDYDRALADMSEAITLDSKAEYPYFNRGITYQAKGDNVRALADFDAAIKANPRFALAFNRRGLLQESLGNLPAALADFKAALAINPKFPNATARIARLEEKIAAAAQPAPAATGTDTRVALVIGNSAYANVQKLPNPKADAEKIAETLRAAGFAHVTIAFDLTRDKFVDTLKTFASVAARADWGVVYFAGHGIEFDGNNFLIPIEAKLESDRDVAFEAVALDQVLLSVEGAKKLRLVILDACRDNPFAKSMKRSVGGTRSVGRGLAQIEPEGATLVAYAAKHGQYAMDGEPGVNSPFVRALVKNLETPGIEISLLFRKVRDEVMAATGRKQEPFTYGSLPSEELFFRKR